MIKRTALILITSFIFFISSAQEYTVSGYIKDAKKQEPIIGAAVFEANTVTNGTPTDTEGYFSLDFTKSNILLKVGYIGFKDTVLDLHLTGDTSITVFMQSATEIEEVEIDKNEIKWKPKDNSIAGNQKDASARLFDKNCLMENIKIYVPHFITLKPELTNLEDLFYTKGKGSNQALTFIDGTRMYSTNQVLSFQPLVDKNSIKSIKYFYGNYPAKYGAYLSPVLDISMEEGDEDAFSGSATISLINTNINLQAPVIKGVSSIFVSGNFNYFNNAYADIFRSENDLWTKPSSYDIFAKYSHKLSENDKVYASFFTTNNKNEYELINERLDDIVYSSEMTTSEKKVNTLLSAHWEHVFSPDFVSDVFLSFSKYKLNQEILEDTIGLVAGTRSIIANANTDIKSTNNDISLNLNFKYNAISDHNIEFGASATNHNFMSSEGNLAINDFSNVFSFDTTWQEDAINAQEYIVFAQDKYTFSDELDFFLGMHFSAFVSDNKTYFSVQPRITANYELFDWVSLNASYSNYKQYIHFVSNRYA
ncbi:MAG: TonB-dependent receptor, partial [Chlorobi bacterium]|nr:TonB-dependent receptor [Chlorobiota bacterium]